MREFAENSSLNVVIIFADSLIEAQREIWNCSKRKPVVFIDADVKITKNAFRELLNPMANDTKIMVSYAESEYAWPKKLTTLLRIYKLYTDEKLMRPRRYFHGRMFAIRDWSIPVRSEVVARARQNGEFLLKYGGGLLTDDIILSFYIINKHGESSIVQIDDQLVTSRPIEKMSDWREMNRRSDIELTKIMKWFPEYRKIGKMPRKTDWTAFVRASLREKAYWILYLLLRVRWSLSSRAELALVAAHAIEPREQWKILESTKR